MGTESFLSQPQRRSNTKTTPSIPSATRPLAAPRARRSACARPKPGYAIPRKARLGGGKSQGAISEKLPQKSACATRDHDAGDEKARNDFPIRETGYVCCIRTFASDSSSSGVKRHTIRAAGSDPNNTRDLYFTAAYG